MGTRPRTWSHGCRSCSGTSECVCPQLGIKSSGTVRGAEEHLRSSLDAFMMPKSTQGSSCIHLGPVRCARRVDFK